MSSERLAVPMPVKRLGKAMPSNDASNTTVAGSKRTQAKWLSFSYTCTALLNDQQGFQYVREEKERCYDYRDHS